ncbi:hypothetical protein [Diaminobutyricimonas sp. LJ205]|uniref:phage major capsid protein n=1 Tax=Diaminobutyricimonas sp. LJ205 TaxID=2683590 RepID=UPI0012F4FDDE|nr:hypothetical protein [Diaminobutyricimonas sp. LJ205]
MTETALFADVEKRTIRGLLLPYNEMSSPSISKTEPVMFAPGTVELPADPSVVTANEGHSQFEPRGRAVILEDTPAGVIAEFAIARTPEGDALLARAADPDTTKRPRLSAEIRGLVRDGAKAIKSTLTGAAFVPQGAFASAALFSVDEEEADDIEDRITAAVKAALAEHTEPEDNPSEEPEEEEEIMTASAAVVPGGLTPPATPLTPSMSANSLFASLANARSNPEALKDAGQLGDLFAIATVQHSGPSTVTIGADVQVPQALGELWKRRRYERKFVPLFSQAALTSMKARGWRWVDGKEPEVNDYTGNTAEIPSNAVDTEEVTADAKRIAGGHKLDRRFIDFGDTTVISSYFDRMSESYARVSDARTLTAALTASTALASTVAPPTGVATGLSAIVDGALSIIDAENTPSFAVVSPELWRAIVLTPTDYTLGYLSASLGLEDGNVGGFRIIPGAVGAGKVLVGAKEAMTVFELPGVPIRVEGIDPHHGAIDPALFGYYATIANNTKALQLVTAYTAA